MNDTTNNINIKELAQADIESLSKSFNTNIKYGLSSEQALKNQQRFGKNEFYRVKKQSIIQKIIYATTEPIILLLLFAAFLAVCINVYEYIYHNNSNFLECIGILIAISLSIAITIIMEDRSAKAFEALNDINNGNLIKTIRNGEISLKPQNELAVGDIIILESGDKIPADCRIIESKSLGVMCDESSLTGESKHTTKSQTLESQDSTNTYKNILYSGCFITQGSVKAMCIAVGYDTEFGKIASALNTSSKTTTPLQEKLKKLSHKITILGGSAALLAFIIQVIFLSFRDLETETLIEHITEAFISSIVLIVASVPEGLPTIVAVLLALNIVKMSKQNALVKKLVACETIGCVNIICSDKTGTLTKNQMSVEKEYIHNKIEDVLLNCILNSTADIAYKDSNYQFLGNPTECALLVFSHKNRIDYKEIREKHKIVNSFPFSSQTKNMTSVVKIENNLICFSKGSPEVILAQCNLDNKTLKNITEKISKLQEQAYRILAFSHKFLDTNNSNKKELESNMIFDGFVAILDPLRDDVKEAIANCMKAGIDIKILTGDNLKTAQAIGKQLEIIDKDHLVFEASKLESLSNDELCKLLPKIKIIARSTPSTKMQIVNALKEQGNVVALTGDGINDAPALRNADVGIAMGISGTEVSKEASDIVLLNDSFSTIVKAIEWGRGIYKNFQRFIQFQLTVNISSVIIVLSAVIMGFTAPFSALQLLWVNLIMDGPPALTLGLEPISKNLLKEKPIKRDSNIITKNMFISIFVNGIFIATICLLQYFTNFLSVAESERNTTLFTLFVLFALFNAFNARELNNNSIFKDISSNKIMLGTFIITFAMQVLIVEFGGSAFHTTPLELETWCKILLISSSIIILGEITRTSLKLFSKTN
ncbi:calcium-translocating P-type ATPase, PMCA-type [Helicobacter ibis]|uniref:P-type Ca(2+) transporter n=1 Tax=Helicobacter ibis TaxID=2962633 RepID=A0ABT4VCH1_9HELI|nr:calcium-translocating P-type ATPase, PMCA-type [Helicobacter ibis]MDA3968406.1 calcium-translocating P-type ATPase, PMCA-type [Helicobacter ibis]